MLFSKHEKGVSLLEISFCLVIISMLLVSVMNFYKEYLIRNSYNTTARQISGYLDDVRQYIENNDVSNIAYSTEHCVALLDDDFLAKKILQNAASHTTINQRFKVFVKKAACNNESNRDEKYFILFAFSGGKEMNTTNARRLAAMIGHRGGVYASKIHTFQGWKDEWRVSLSDWGIQETDYMMAACDYITKQQPLSSGQARLYGIDLVPYLSGIMSDNHNLAVNSPDNKLRIVWRGAAIKYVNLTLTISKGNDEMASVKIQALSYIYGGEYHYDLPFIAEAGQYSFRVHITVYGYNNTQGTSIDKELVITYK